MAEGGTLNDALWVTPGNWSTGNIPIDASDAIMNSGKHVVGDFTSAKVGLGNLILPREFHRNLGASGGPLTTSAAVLKHLGSGNLYLDADSDASQLTMAKAYINPSNAGAIVVLGSNTGDKADWDDIEIYRGAVTMKANTAFGDTAVILVKPRNFGDASLTIAASAETLPTLNFEGGVLVSANVITTLNFRGGDGTHDSAVITTLNLFAGYFRYNWSIGGTVNLHTGATFDLMANNIFKATFTINKYLNSTLIYNADLHTSMTINELGIEG